jgi:hypothetical protein
MASRDTRTRDACRASRTLTAGSRRGRGAPLPDGTDAISTMPEARRACGTDVERRAAGSAVAERCGMPEGRAARGTSGGSEPTPKPLFPVE